MVLPFLSAAAPIVTAGAGLAGSLFGGGQRSQVPAQDYATLAALQLASGQAGLTGGIQEAFAQLGSQLSTENLYAGTLAGLNLDRFTQGITTANLGNATSAALAQAFGSAGISHLANQANARTTSAANAFNTGNTLGLNYSQIAGNVSDKYLTTQGAMLGDITKNIGARALSSASVSDKYASDMGSTAMYGIRTKMDTDAKRQLINEQVIGDIRRTKAQGELHFAKQRDNRGAALGAMGSWA